MNRIYIFLLAVMVFSCAPGQPKDNRLFFSVKIKPEQQYHISTQSSYSTEVRYEGKEKAMNKLRSMGVKNPNILSRSNQTMMLLKTENVLDNYIPVRLEIVKSTGNDGQTDISQGLVVNGESSGGNMPEFRSIASGKSPVIDEKLFLQSLQNNFSRLALPEKRMNIGEQFTVESTLTIPMEKSHVEIALSTIYMLKSVEGDVANFEISQNYQMSQLRMDNSFAGVGEGSGKLIYNAANNMVTLFEMKSRLEINKKLENFLFVLKTKSEFVQKIEVAKK